MPDPNHNRGYDASETMLFIFVLLLLLGIGFYFFLFPHLREFWLVIARVEAHLLLWTTYGDAALREQAEALIHWTKTTNAENISMRRYQEIRHFILAKGNHNYIIFAIIGLLSIYTYWKRTGYYGIPTVEGLIFTERRVWPVLEFLYRFNPLREWNELRGVGRYMVSPFVYAVENKILRNYKAKSKYDRVFDDTAARTAFSRDLGPRFESFIKLPPFYKALISMVCAKELRDDIKYYDDIIRYLAIALSNSKQTPEFMATLMAEVFDPVMHYLDGKDPEKPSNALIAQLIKDLKSNHQKTLKDRKKDKYLAKPSVFEIMQDHARSHAYCTTIVVAASRTVKRHGKFPAGRMVFFKHWDRHLFMILSNSPYFIKDKAQASRFVSGFSAEVLGVYGHYQHELTARRKLNEPWLDTAIEGLRARLIRQNLIPDTRMDSGE